MNICIIPARGGSKRIPRKNIKDFHGLPIIAYSIKAAQQSNLFSHIIVSTDDHEIAQVAKKYGADVPFIRPAELSNDYANTFDLMAHAAQWVRDNFHEVKYLCCLYATAPFVKYNYIQLGLDLLIENPKADYAYSVTEYPFPIQRSVRNNNGYVTPFFPDSMLMRSQDLEPSFHDAGQFYWGKITAFCNQSFFFGDNSLGVKIPRNIVIDIDTEEDWLVASLMYDVIHKVK